jgi:C-terminal peptidase prc
MIIRMPASSDPGVFSAQRTLLEAWQIVSEAYEDSSFNGRNWEGDLAEGLMATYEAGSAEEAYEQVQVMLGRLGDPYTRIIPPQEFRDFRIGSDGELHGVGLMIAQDPDSRRLMVLASLEGSPAARAGIQPGDEVISIDGLATEGFNGDRAAALLRGSVGTNVTVRFARRTVQVPGVAGRPELPPKVQLVKVNLRRERLEVNPVFSTAFAHPGPRGRPTTTGYIRLVNFNSHAAEDVQRAIRSLKAQGASSFILDLRQNPGGLVRAGVDVARLFLDAPAPVFNVSGRTPAALPASALPDSLTATAAPPPKRIMQKVVLASSRAVTKQPLALLVDGQSASASEILAGALRDNGHRAVLIGDQKTYGKGKIQNVFELADGSALFVTVARYKTPALVDIDKVGIEPDLRCHAVDAPPALDRDGRLQVAGRELPPGLPMGLAMQLRTANSLQDDACVLTAERYLDSIGSK